MIVIREAVVDDLPGGGLQLARLDLELDVLGSVRGTGQFRILLFCYDFYRSDLVWW